MLHQPIRNALSFGLLQIPEEENTDKAASKKELIQALQAYRKKDEVEFSLFLFSNETRILEIKKELNQKPAFPKDNKIRVAILVGESHIFAFLPVLHRLNIDLVMINDINPLLHTHIEFLLNCLRKADNINAFNSLYKKLPHPLLGATRFKFGDGGKKEKGTITVENLFPTRTEKIFEFCVEERFRSPFNEYEQVEFSNEFKQCKEAIHRIQFVFSSVDLLNIDECSQLKETLNCYNASVEILNITNLHYYHRDETKAKSNSPYLISNIIDLLFKNSERPQLLFSYGNVGPYKNDPPLFRVMGTIKDYIKMINFSRQYALLNVEVQEECLDTLIDQGNKLIEELNNVMQISSKIFFGKTGNNPAIYLKPSLQDFPKDSPEYKKTLALYHYLVKKINPLKYEIVNSPIQNHLTSFHRYYIKIFIDNFSTLRDKNFKGLKISNEREKFSLFNNSVKSDNKINSSSEIIFKNSP